MSKPPEVKPTKAYRNNEFLSSRHARGIRIMCELEETVDRLDREGVSNTILFFGTARAKSSSEHAAALDAAKAALAGGDAKAEAAIARLEATAWLCPVFDRVSELSKRLTEWSVGLSPGGPTQSPFVVATGGGPGLMEAANYGAHGVDGGRSVGMGISLPFEAGLNPYVTPELGFEYHYFFTRKFFMINNCSALIVLPGGYGTMDELFETLTLMQTGKKHPKIPVVMFGAAFWRDVVNWDALVRYGVISQADVDQLHFTDDVEDAFEFVCAALSSQLNEPADEGSSATSAASNRHMSFGT